MRDDSILILTFEALGCIGFGSVFLLAWIARLRRLGWLRRNGVRVEGRVVGYCGHDDDVPHLVVEFLDSRGTEHRVTLSDWYYDDPPVGQPISLVYDPDDPGAVSRTPTAQMRMVDELVCLLGSVLVLIGVGVLVGILLTN